MDSEFRSLGKGRKNQRKKGWVITAGLLCGDFLFIAKLLFLKARDVLSKLFSPDN